MPRKPLVCQKTGLPFVLAITSHQRLGSAEHPSSAEDDIQDHEQSVFCSEWAGCSTSNRADLCRWLSASGCTTWWVPIGQKGTFIARVGSDYSPFDGIQFVRSALACERNLGEFYRRPDIGVPSAASGKEDAEAQQERFFQTELPGAEHRRNLAAI
jgi:hypothetical protein